MLKAGGHGKTSIERQMRRIPPVDGKRFKRQIEFILEADKLKKVARRTTLLDVSRRENSAEHSWHIALLVLILCEYAEDQNLNLLRVIKLLLIHDLVEIDAGDTYCYDEVGNQDQLQREIRAAERIFNILPADQADALRALWDEYEARATPESKFANAVDRVQPFLHNYFTRGHTWQKHGIRKSQVVKRMKPVHEGSQTLWEYVSSLIDDAVQQGFLAQ
ncbi:MAG: HD domain-containing protein [Desulfobacterales bacterium]|jgi:putative hydrolase of HD superfamily